MDAALARLIEALPPPEGLLDLDINWSEVESDLGFAFPKHIKEYVGVYGNSGWFDLYGFFSFSNIVEYLHRLRELLKTLERACVGWPMYPAHGGLFPFMGSSDGDYYFWKMDTGDPDKWLLMVWQMPGLFELPSSTTAELLLDTLNEFKNSDPDRVWLWAHLPDGIRQHPPRDSE